MNNDETLIERLKTPQEVLKRVHAGKRWYRPTIDAEKMVRILPLVESFTSSLRRILAGISFRPNCPVAT